MRVRDQWCWYEEGIQLLLKHRRYRAAVSIAFLVLATGTTLNCVESDQSETSAVPSGEVDWVVYDEPILSIGLDGDPHYEFSHIVGMGRLPSGMWYVVDRVAAEVRLFDRAGRFVHATGRRGEGPGEFLDVRFAAHTSDGHIYTYDQRLRRLSKFDAEGHFVASTSVSAKAPGSVYRAVGISDNNTIVWASFVYPQCIEGAVQTDTVFYFTQTIDSGPGRALRLLPRGEARQIQSVPGAQRWGNTLNQLHVCMPSNVPYSQSPLDAVSGNSLYVALRERLEIIATDVTTGYQQRGVEGVARQPLTEADRATYIQQIQSMVQRDEKGAELPASTLQLRRLREGPFPDSLPIADQFVVDVLGYAWVRPYSGAAEDGWWVFSPGGGLKGRVKFTDRLYVKEIGTDYIAGIETDEFGAPTVRVYRLVRSKRPSS